MNKQRMVDLDIGRGLMMVLLVYRHAISRELPQGNDWYIILYQVFHWFQMPVFFYFSGIVMAHTFKRPDSLPEYFQYIGKRFIRLVPAYILFATIIFLGKMLLQSMVQVENPITGVNDYFTIFIAPKTSPFASFLWFVYVVFIFYLLTSLYIYVVHRNILWLLALAVIVRFIPVPDFLALNLIFGYLVYFIIGYAIYRYYSSYLKLIDRYFSFFMLGFIGICVLAYYVKLPSELPIALISIPAVHGFVRLGPVLNSRFLRITGDYMYPIYLMNTIPINVVRIAILTYFSWHGLNFLIILPVLMFSGIFFPIVVQKYIISKIPILNKIVRA